MKRCMRNVAWAAVAALAAPNVAAYELATHAAMTQAAYDRSLSQDNGGLGIRLGIFRPPNYGSVYFDILMPDGTINFRIEQAYEHEQMPNGLRNPDFLRFNGWLMRGAVREDDGGLLAGRYKGEPRDDPYGLFNRFCSHFFDPVHDIAFTGYCGGETIVEKAPNWAIGTSDAFAPSVVAAPNYRNHFAIFTAREAMWRALTLKDAQGADLFPQANPGLDRIRTQYWATTVRALGDVVHLLQDMAQPQHTRNEGHFLSHTGYEERVNDRALGRTINVFDKQAGQFVVKPMAPLNLMGLDQAGFPYPIPRFDRYSDFWATVRGSDTTGKGLANYSNREFFTVGTSIGQSSTFNLPSRVPENYGKGVQANCDRQNALTVYLIGTVQDLAAGRSETLRLQSSGLFQASALQNGLPAQYTVNTCLFDDYADILLPRAVAYSAGLIDYFFRGTLRIELPPENVYAVQDVSAFGQPNAGFRTLKVMVQNNTPSNTPPGATAPQYQSTNTAGKLVAVLSFRRNTCLQLPILTGSPTLNPDGTSFTWDESCRQPSRATQPLPDIIVSDPAVFPPDGIDLALQPVIFNFPTALPFNAVDVDLQVVYRGQLGTETDGIAVGFEHINEPTFFNFDNYYDCFTDRQCPIGTTDPTCYVTDSVKLPFPEAQDAPGWRRVASISNLAPGQYGRVGFLTRSAFREAPPATLEVVTNENFPYEVDVTYVPDGEMVVWPPGPTIRSPLVPSRPVFFGGSTTNMLEWWAHGAFKASCVNGLCGVFPWASQCAPIDPTPQPVTVMFP